MRNIVMSILFLFPQSEDPQKIESYSDIGAEFPLIWKTKIGVGSFRTNVSVSGDKLIIGSNGSYFKDYNLYDKLSGVYVLNRKTGNVANKFADENLGDMDVNGVLLFNGSCYFGNDNEEFLCTNMKGDILWRNAASGDIESEPVLIDVKGRKILVYASESGEVTAVDPENGKRIWQYFTPDFSGYKPGDNRAIFKVKAFFSNTVSFFTKPQLVDLNSDAVLDLIYLTWDKQILALNGTDGKTLWNYQSDNLLSDDFIVSKNKTNPIISVQEFVYQESIGMTACDLLSFDKKGNIVEKKRFNGISRDVGLNHFIDNKDTAVISFQDSLFFLKDGKICRSVYYDRNPFQKQVENWIEKINYRDVLFSENSFAIKGHPRCVALLNQRDYVRRDFAILEIISLDNGEVLSRFAIPENSEMPPVVKDINKDGFLDLLISGYDGYLYCYNLKTRG